MDFGKLKQKLTTKAGIIGDYDFKSLFLPRIPCIPSKSATSRGIFFGLKDDLPILVACLVGLTHALASAGGIISVPRILSGAGLGHLNLPTETQSFLVSTALIVSGLMSIIQIIRIKIVKGYYIGSGLISISGTSFTFLPIAESMFSALYDEGYCKIDAEGISLPCPDAYGRWLGTIMVGALLEIALSFMPPKMIKKIFPPIVTGSVVTLIGASLVGVGLKYWAGGAGPCISPPTDFFATCPNILAKRNYPWADAHWIGLGFLVLATIILVEIFGSPFMRNIAISIGFIVGTVVAASTGYLNTGVIEGAPGITFLWVKTFKFGFYAPALLPVLIGYLVSTVESIGDISASCEVSRLDTDGEEYESRIQGGLLADGVNSLISGLMGNSPTTTFSQNNGVIAQTNCANTSAGLWAAGWLIFFGVIGKIGALVVAVPDAVLGGMTTFLFANVFVSGLRILSGLKWTRRDRFILAVTFVFGLGVVVVPKAFTTFIPEASSRAVKGLRQGVVIVLSTGYSIGALISVLLNFLLPQEEDALSLDELDQKKDDPPVESETAQEI